MSDQNEELTDKEENFRMDDQGRLQEAGDTDSKAPVLFDAKFIGMFIMVVALEVARILESVFFEDALLAGIIAGIVVVAIPKAIYNSRKFYYVLAGAVLNFVIMKYFQQDHLAPLMIVVMLLIVKWEARKKKKNNHE